MWREWRQTPARGFRLWHRGMEFSYALYVCDDYSFAHKNRQPRYERLQVVFAIGERINWIFEKEDRES